VKKRIININTDQLIKAIYLLIVLLSITAIAAHAQSDPGGDTESAPIDGGLSLLIAGGVGYGIKKIREKRKQKKNWKNKGD